MAFNPGIAGACLIGTAATVGGSLCIGEWDFDDFGGGTEDENEVKVRSKEPGYGHILADDYDYNGENDVKPYKDKYGGKHHKHFVGVTKKVVVYANGGKRETAADGGGAGTYRENYSQDATGGFSREIVTKGEELREACKNAFLGTLNASTKEIEYKDKKYKEEDVWKFCSPASEVPVAIADDEEYTTGTIGQKLKSKLSSTRDNNDRYGEIKKNIFFRTSNTVDKVPEYFKKLRERNLKSYQEKQVLRHKCEEAYNKVPVGNSTADAPTEEDVLKYCALEESE